MSRIFDDVDGSIASVVTGTCDDGDSLCVEFKCGGVQGWLDVQDGIFGKKIAVWLYDKPVNRCVASIDVEAIASERTRRGQDA